MIVDELVDLAAAMIDAMRAGRSRPCRNAAGWVVSTLTRLMVDRSLPSGTTPRSLRTPAAGRGRAAGRGVPGAAHRRDPPRRLHHPGGRSARRVGVPTVAVTCMHELMQEMMDDDMVGDFWWEEIDRQETDNPGVLAESEREMIERLKILDSIEDALQARGLRD